MKTAILTFSAFLVLVSSCQGSKKVIDNQINNDIQPPQGNYIFSSSIDATLKKGTAVANLSFIPGSEAKIGDTLAYSVNGKEKKMVISDLQLMKVKLDVKPGNYVFQVALLAAKKETITPQLTFSDQSVNELIFNFEKEEDRMIVFKPVVYTYGNEVDFSMNVSPVGQFTFTYPSIAKGWNGKAHEDGSSTIQGKTYPYLFWEAERTVPFPLNDQKGFYVSKDEVVTFLEEKLTAMGLNDKEQTDFITFWGPQMTQLPYGKVQFLFNEQYDAIGALTVEPKPTSLFRVYMIYTGYNEQPSAPIEPQKLEQLKRSDWTVVEWGGSKIMPKTNENQ